MTLITDPAPTFKALQLRPRCLAGRDRTSVTRCAERLSVPSRCSKVFWRLLTGIRKRATVVLLLPLSRRFKQKRSLGREDEADGNDPVVLTDSVCLIPGDAPVVRVEDAPGNARRIFTGVDIFATVEEVWEVMTDYEALQSRVPNLAQNTILERFDDGGARLWQVGQAKWKALGKELSFKAGATLDVHLHPEGLAPSQVAGQDMCASSSAEVRVYDRTLPLVRDVFPRPFSLAAEGVPIRDITMQNVQNARGDFVHYRGVWRLQPLEGCGPPGQDMTRLTFAVECQPVWYMPVAPVEGRIAEAMVENMVAIRDFIESQNGMSRGLSPVLAEQLWDCVLEQHPEAVRDKAFLNVPFEREDLATRWPRFVKTLGIPEEQALEIVVTDVTPLLVQSDEVAEILTRLAAISSREKALELIGINPSLLVGGAIPREGGPVGLGIAAIADILYAGRLRSVVEDSCKDDECKIEEIEVYSQWVSGLKPFMKGQASPHAVQAFIQRTLDVAARLVPSDSLRIFLSRLAMAPDPLAFLLWQARAGLSVVVLLAQQPSLALSIAEHSPGIIPHLPSIYTRLSVIAPHVPGIVRILDPYFETVRPHLDRIMERMDEIEPHLPFILVHLDVLAKHCGALLDHFDVLLPFATRDEREDLEIWRYCYKASHGNSRDMEGCMLKDGGSLDEWTKSQRSYLPLLLGYIDFIAPRLESLKEHLPLVRPHMAYILPYMDALLEYVDLFAEYPAASGNADVLTAYLGWVLYVPVLPRILHVRHVPWLITKLSNWLPRWPVRWILRRRRRRLEQSMMAAAVYRAVGEPVQLRSSSSQRKTVL